MGSGRLPAELGGKQLYCVEIEVYVMATNEEEACEIAARECQAEEAVASVATTINHQWADSIPYNADADETCAAILNRQRDYELGEDDDEEDEGFVSNTDPNEDQTELPF